MSIDDDSKLNSRLLRHLRGYMLFFSGSIKMDPNITIEIKRHFETTILTLGSELTGEYFEKNGSRNKLSMSVTTKRLPMLSAA